MLVQLTGTDGINKKPIWIEADTIKLIAVTDGAKIMTVLYQQDSDMPIYVDESEEEVVKLINDARTKT